MSQGNERIISNIKGTIAKAQRDHIKIKNYNQGSRVMRNLIRKVRISVPQPDDKADTRKIKHE